MDQIPTLEELVTPSPNTEVKNYPTKWEKHDDEGFVNNPGNIDYRYLDEHRVELRSTTHLLVVDEEGFRLFKDQTLQGHVLFADWCARNSVKPIAREDIDHGVASE